MPAVGVKEAEAGSVAKLNRPIFTELECSGDMGHQLNTTF
jgi:hypothetical protein